MEYIPTPGSLPGEQWKPSNGTVGYSFLENECGNCARDKAMSEGVPLEDCDVTEMCPIIAASFRGQAVEWRRMSDGEVKCIKFVPAGQPIPPEKDDRTMGMFDAPIQEQSQMNTKTVTVPEHVFQAAMLHWKATKEDNGTELANLIQQHILSAPSAQVQPLPPDWVAVPREPTDEMVDAACDIGEGLYRVDFVRAYEAAIAAAPSEVQAKPREEKS